jgi:hypothetical protein
MAHYIEQGEHIDNNQLISFHVSFLPRFWKASVILASNAVLYDYFPAEYSFFPTETAANFLGPPSEVFSLSCVTTHTHTLSQH